MDAVLTIHKDLITRSIDGDQSAQAALYGHYAKAMFNVCMRFMKNREDAEDVLQESFVTAFLRMHTFRFESSFGSWLKRLVINQCINSLKKARLPMDFLEEVGSYSLSNEEDGDTSEEVNFNVQQVKAAMQALPEGSRMVFSLYLLEGYDHGEIAGILDISETTSKTQYMRAKRKIVSWVKQNAAEDEGC